MRNTFTLFTALILLVCFFVFVQPIKICKADGNILYVDDSGGSDYTTIQAAINAADNNDTIIVASGNYNENLQISKSLIISGASKDDTIISGSSTGHVIQITADNVEISGFTIQNAVGTEYDCILMNKADNCKITNNIIRGSDEGIYLLDSHNNTINNNNIEDNDANGIFSTFSDNNIFSNNQILFNENGINIGSYSDNNEIFDNNILGKTGVISVGIGLNIGTSTTGNVVYRNHFNDFDKNANDIGSSNTWYKSSTHEGNYYDDYNNMDANSDGIGDVPYNIAGTVSNQDIYPLGIFIKQDPVSYITSITPNPAFEEDIIHFIGSYTYDGEILAYEWVANGQIIGTQKDIDYSSLTSGAYTIGFRVKSDEQEWSDYYQSTLTVKPVSNQQNQQPTAIITSISPTTQIYRYPVYFVGSGQDQDGEIIWYEWSSSIDGYLSNAPSFSRSNLSPGTHEIKFKVRDNYNVLSNIDNRTIKIIPDTSQPNNPPVAIINELQTGYANTSISFNGSQSRDNDPDDHITSYKWDFGDTTTGSGKITTHTYTTTGNFTVKLTVTDTYGIQSTQTTTITITNTNNGQTNNNNDNKWIIPGFEIIVIIAALTLIILLKKSKNIFKK